MRDIKATFVLKTDMSDDQVDTFLIELLSEFQEHLLDHEGERLGEPLNYTEANEEVTLDAWTDQTPPSGRVVPIKPLGPVPAGQGPKPAA